VKTRIYVVEESDGVEKSRMVEATSQAAAVNHVVRNRYAARVASATEVHQLTLKGIELEKAGDKPTGGTEGGDG
jgi:hypothetical protein